MKHARTAIITIFILFAVLINPATARQADSPFTIGFLSWYGIDAFKDEMAGLGYIEGQNINYMTVSYEGLTIDSPPEAYIEAQNVGLQAMIDAHVNVFVTLTDTDVVNIKDKIGNAPVVFSVSDDPVATGIVSSLVAPGGNATGLITNRPHERRLQLLTEIKPTKKIYYLYSTFTLEADTVLHEVENVAADLGVEVVPAPITDLNSALTDLQNTPADTDWLFLTPYVPFDPQFFQSLMEVSMSHQAGIAGVTNAPVQGYVIGYGPDSEQLIRRAGHIVDLILRGANPADIPVETGDNYLTVNLEAAAAINVDVPEAILRQADLIVRPGYFDNLAMPTPGA